ncbi:MAG: hypothetical protein E7313_05435 [Clostridiales bacterium]|nr:hypothetical protein [Clostridiales bacterium]
MLTFVPHKINEDYKKVEFYRVNKELLNSEEYRGLSPTAILLYSLLCDRLSLCYNNISKNKNHYYDENKNMYVIFTRMNLEEKLHVGKAAISSAFEQLKKANLIQEKRQGKNKPNRIYVGKTLSEINENFVNGKSENRTSGNLIFGHQEVRKSDGNNNNIFNIKNKDSKYLNYEERDYSKFDWSNLYANKNLK